MTSKHHRARLARVAAVCAVAATGALSFASAASAATYPVSTEAQLETALTTINGDSSGTTQTITLAPGTYQPGATLNLTGTDPVVIQGPTPSPTQIGSPAIISGAAAALAGNTVLTVAPGAKLTVNDVVFQQAGLSSNPSPAIDDQGTVSTVQTTFTGNSGVAGVFVESGATGNFTESTFAGNSTGVLDQGTATFTNSTVALNKTTAGLYIQGGTASLINTIVAKNKVDCVGGTVSSATTSIDGDGTCGLTGTGNLSSKDSTINLAPNALSSYGGVTATVPPLPGSPAIGAGTDSYCTAAVTDQRGFAYSGTTCNIGSVETRTTAPTFTQAPISATIASGQTSVVVNYPTAVSTTDWTDAAFPLKTSTFAATPSSGSSFNAGTTAVAVSISDYYGNAGTGSFNVVAGTATAPTVTITPAGGTANSNVTVTGTSAAGASVAFAATATDTIDGSITPTCKVGTTTVTSPYTFPFGTSTLTCSATNSNNLTGTQSITVTVNDTAPTVTVPASFSVFGATGASVTVNYPTAAKATDLKDGTDTVTCTPITDGSSITMPASQATVTVTCSATNSSSQTSSATFVVTEVPGLPTSATGNVQGHVKCTEGLTQPPLVTTYGTSNDIADFGYFQVGVPADYTASASTQVTDTCSKATVDIQDTNTSTTFAGHLLSDNAAVAPTSGNPNPAGYELASALKASATSTNSYATPGAQVSLTNAPQGILSYSGPVNADPVSVNFAQHIDGTQVLVNKDYSATVLLTIATTP